MDKYKIVTEARKWLGTPFKHQGRVKHQGCDCIGLIIGVFKNLHLKDSNGNYLHEHDIAQYGRIPDGKILRQKLSQNLREININDAEYGDIMLMKFRDEPQHVAIISDYTANCSNSSDYGMIHCYAESGKTVEHRIDDLWRSRVITCYSINRPLSSP